MVEVKCPSKPRSLSATDIDSDPQALRRTCILGALDGFVDQLLGVVGIAPALKLDPFVGFKVLVVLKKMLDLVKGDLG